MASVCSFAQTFYVDPVLNPDGIFLAAVDVCFALKDDHLPITLQIRPTVNGYPDISNILHGGISTIYPDKIPTSTGVGSNLPNFTDPTIYTRFAFPALVYLIPGEYAMVFQSASTQYFVYLAELQKQILGSTGIVSQQPYVGSLFRSQNSDTWTPYQNQDLMFRIIKATFDTTKTATLEFDNIPSGYTSNVNMDVFNFNGNDIVLHDTVLSYTYKSTDTTGAVDVSATNLPINHDVLPTTRRIINSAGSTFKAFASLTTDSPDVSPIVDLTRLNIVAVENLINNGPLSNSIINMNNTGSGYQNVNNVVVTIDAPTGTGITAVQATGVPVFTNNTITSIILTANGSGYVVTPNVSISGGAPSVAATANVTGETSSIGGNALARYITRKVVLTQGFDSEDIQVYLTGCRQAGTSIEVYYKVMSEQDTDQNFGNKLWTRMVLNNNKNIFSQDFSIFNEYSYISPAAASVPPARISYINGGTTYKTFRTFAIKICLFSDSTVNVPVVKNLRVIAIA